MIRSWPTMLLIHTILVLLINTTQLYAMESDFDTDIEEMTNDPEVSNDPEIQKLLEELRVLKEEKIKKAQEKELMLQKKRQIDLEIAEKERIVTENHALAVQQLETIQQLLTRQNKMQEQLNLQQEELNKRNSSPRMPPLPNDPSCTYAHPPQQPDSSPPTPPASESLFEKSIREVLRLNNPLTAALLALPIYLMQNKDALSSIASFFKPAQQNQNEKEAPAAPTQPPTTPHQNYHAHPAAHPHPHHAQQHPEPQPHHPQEGLPVEETVLCECGQYHEPVHELQPHYPQNIKMKIPKKLNSGWSELLYNAFLANLAQTTISLIPSLRCHNGWKFLGCYVGVEYASRYCLEGKQKRTHYEPMPLYLKTAIAYVLGFAF